MPENEQNIKKAYEKGFYWVKTATIPGEQVGEWQPAFFNGDEWEICGQDQSEDTDFFDFIGERIMGEYQPIRGGA